MRVVVIGGGFAGMAAAARLAKLGHEVTLLERGPRLGGALGFVSQGGFRWDAGPTAMLLPAVVRDLFRKSGRPLEREIDLVPVDPVREHRFTDGSVVRLPGGSRSAQYRALEGGLGRDAGQAWLDWTAGHAETWELLRADLLERPWQEDAADRRTRRLLRARGSLHRSLRRGLKDERLRLLAEHPVVLEGHDPRDVPAWVGVMSYLEQSFGVWTVPKGLGGLAEALVRRLAQRRVEVHTSTPALDLLLADGVVTGVRTDAGAVPADRVVVATDPRRLPATAHYARRTLPAVPASMTHLGLVGEVPDLPHEVVLHGDPVMVLRTNGTVLDEAPDGASAAWTVLVRGNLGEDLLTGLARRGLDVRDRVAVRLERPPTALVEEWGGSPWGIRWQGRRTLERRLPTALPDLLGGYAAGAHALPGPGLPFVGLSAALVARSLR